MKLSPTVLVGLFLMCASASAYDTQCSSPIQKNLRYNASSQPIPQILPSPEFPNETLADAVACDKYYINLDAAEPSGFLNYPFINFFESMKQYTGKDGKTTFYDIACGIPLFSVPQGRTLQEFKAESTEHGWPSFRPEEVIGDNVIISADGREVHSKCGTHLGHNIPDNKGTRFCLNVVTTAGNPVKEEEEATAAPAENLVLQAQPTKYADLVTYDQAKGTTWSWKDLNDPVMGGRSTSTFSIDKTKKIATFNGTVAIVPSLKAPGFCNAETTNWFAHFNDASAYSHLIIKARTTTPAYAGFKASFAADTIDPQFDSYKANFNVTSSEWQWIAIPFTKFSNDWSSFTGDCFTKDPNGKQHYCCDKSGESPSKSSVCASTKKLKDISQIGLWTEGHAGDFHLEVERIGAGIP